MELVARRPAEPLRGVALEYRGFRDDHAGAPGAEAQREHPSACVPLIIDVGVGWRVAAPADGYRPLRRAGFMAGMHDAFAVVEAAGPSFGVQVDLDPLGARRMFGMPMHELANRIVALEDVFGRQARELRDRIGAAESWTERFAVVDAALVRRLDDAPPVSLGLEWAWRRLLDSDGAVSIGSLATTLGWSRKRLVARFRDEIGLTPKTAARVLRFRALHAGLRRGAPPVSWADIALEYGYADQSHLIRDVHRMTGLTPTELLARMRVIETSVQDPGLVEDVRSAL